MSTWLILHHTQLFYVTDTQRWIPGNVSLCLPHASIWFQPLAVFAMTCTLKCNTFYVSLWQAHKNNNTTHTHIPLVLYQWVHMKWVPSFLWDTMPCHWVCPEHLDAVYRPHSQTSDVQESHKYCSYFVCFLELQMTFIRTVVGTPTISK